MIKENNYINIREVLSRLMRHPLLRDLTLEQVVQYTLDFIGTFGMPKLFRDKEQLVNIIDFRGVLPCDLVSITQIKDCKSNKCLRSMTNTFIPTENEFELAYKTQGQILYTTIKDGAVLISYKTTPIDDEGFPLLIDNSLFLKALEAYIKKEVFTILFDMGKISQVVMQNTQQQYAWLAGQLQSEFTIPSVAEMESISRMWNTLIPRVSEFNNGFKDLGNREYIKVQ